MDGPVRAAQARHAAGLVPRRLKSAEVPERASPVKNMGRASSSSRISGSLRNGASPLSSPPRCQLHIQYAGFPLRFASRSWVVQIALPAPMFC